MLLAIDQAVQLRRGGLDVEILVLPRPALRRDDSTPVHLLEVSIRKLVSPFDIFRLFVVNGEVPPCVFLESMRLDEGVLLLGRRLMFTPRVAVIADDAALSDAGPRERYCPAVDMCCHC
jgi:hypothetical protein